MWVMNQDGFFSVVQDDFCKPNEIVVRARREVDLKNMLKFMKIKSDIHKFDFTDYRYRVYIKRVVFSRYLSERSKSIDYSNFKNTIKDGDFIRKKAYMQCWSSLHELQI